MNINLRISQECWKCCFLYLGWRIETHCIDTFQKLRLSKKKIFYNILLVQLKRQSTISISQIFADIPGSIHILTKFLIFFKRTEFI